MSTITFSQLDFVPLKEDSDELFDAGNLLLSVIYLQNTKLSIEQRFDKIKSVVEPTKPLHLKNTKKDLQNK